MSKLGVIAFCGSKGSGKSTSASIFKELTQLPTEELAIAGHLKEVCSKLFEVDYNKFIDPKLKEVEFEGDYIVLDSKRLTTLLKEFYVTDYTHDLHVRPHVGRVIRTPRSLLQYIGTEVLHPLDPLIHVKVAMKKKDPNRLTIITDLRFVAEFDYFNSNHNSEFVPVYVKNSAAELAASVDAHPSERQFENFKSRCYLLNNESNLLSELETEIMKLLIDKYE